MHEIAGAWKMLVLAWYCIGHTRRGKAFGRQLAVRVDLHLPLEGQELNPNVPHASLCHGGMGMRRFLWRFYQQKMDYAWPGIRSLSTDKSTINTYSGEVCFDPFWSGSVVNTASVNIMHSLPLIKRDAPLHSTAYTRLGTGTAFSCVCLLSLLKFPDVD